MIEEQTVRHVARLARLGLSDEEVHRMRAEMSVILDHVAAIQSLDLEGVPLTTHVVALQNVLRDDVPREGLDAEQALREAPEVEAGGFVVRRIN